MSEKKLFPNKGDRKQYQAECDVREDPWALKHVPDESKTAEMCLSAVQENARALRYVPERLKTAELCSFAVQRGGALLQYVPEALKTPELCLAAVDQIYSYALQYVPEALKTPELCLAAVQRNGETLQYVPETLKTPELCLAAAEQRYSHGYSCALQYVPEALKTPELCLAAVQRNGDSLEFVPEVLKTPELCLAAIENSFVAHEFVPKGRIPPEVCIKGARIKVIGVGGGGISAINHMIASGLRGALFIAADTDTERLVNARTEHTMQLGDKLARSRGGVEGNPDIGRQAAEESLPAIKAAIGEAGLVFVVAGMGGGTGDGAAPVIAKAAKDAGALTIGVTSRPFAWEGEERRQRAETGIQTFHDAVDGLVVIPNDKLTLPSADTAYADKMRAADEAMFLAVSGICDLVTKNGLIALDFADIHTVFAQGGMAAMGIGTASGEYRARDAATRARACPLLDGVSVCGARGVLINITADLSIAIEEIADACTRIQEAAHEDALIIFGCLFDESMGDEVRVTIIVTGIDFANNRAPRARNAAAPVRHVDLSPYLSGDIELSYDDYDVIDCWQRAEPEERATRIAANRAAFFCTDPGKDGKEKG